MELISLLGSNVPLYLAFVAVLGLFFGSFFNVVIYRLPIILEQGWHEQCRELLQIENKAESGRFSLSRPRSRCPSCRSPVAVIDNVPLLSFCLLRGKCRICGSKISLRYPLVEALTAATFVITAWSLGFTYAAAAGIVLTGFLIPLIFIDIDEQILPDSITVPGIWLGLITNYFGVLTDLQSALIGAVAGYLSLWIVYQGFKLLTGKEGMGYGDFKLLAMLGAWLGWQFLPLIILLSATIGAITGIVLLTLSRKGRDTPIPFGPYLCLAGWIALLKGDQIVASYLRFAGLA